MSYADPALAELACQSSACLQVIPRTTWQNHLKNQGLGLPLNGSPVVVHSMLPNHSWSSTKDILQDYSHPDQKTRIINTPQGLQSLSKLHIPTSPKMWTYFSTSIRQICQSQLRSQTPGNTTLLHITPSDPWGLRTYNTIVASSALLWFE